MPLVFCWGFEPFFKRWNVYMRSPATPVLCRYQCWTQIVNNHECCLKYLKLVFEVTKNIQNGTTGPNYVCKAECLQKRIYVGILVLVMCSASSLQDEFWLAESVMWYKCMWLESQKKPEKYGKPMKLAIQSATCITALWSQKLKFAFHQFEWP